MRRVGFRFPQHELVADEKRALINARAAWKEREEKRARYIANASVFDTLIAKREKKYATMAECKTAIQSLDAAKVTKNSPARTFIENQISACALEIKALTKDLTNTYNEYVELSLADYIPDVVLSEFDGKNENEKSE